jgi:putative transposase
MGRSRYKRVNNDAPQFLTFTVLNWLPVFTRPGTVKIILDALHWRQQNKGAKVYGYVVLENHIHCILQAEDLKQQVHDIKAYTAKQLLAYLEEFNAARLLKQLAFFKKAHKTDSKYQLWEEGSHPQMMQNEGMLRQKLEYIHLNPVKRGYVDEAVHWRYSSARDYHGMEGLIPVYTEWWSDG